MRREACVLSAERGAWSFVLACLLLVSLPRLAAAICAAERVFLAISNRTICEAGHTETESARANAQGARWARPWAGMAVSGIERSQTTPAKIGSGQSGDDHARITLGL